LSELFQHFRKVRDDEDETPLVAFRQLSHRPGLTAGTDLAF